MGHNGGGMWDSGMERGGGGMERGGSGMERGGSDMERVAAVRVGRQCGQCISVGRQHIEGGGYTLWGLACRWGPQWGGGGSRNQTG